ncbi:membrane protein [Capsulimonas corticalis]|uniref:Membrane protein n=1 Tax=Capsulimonas corticalis TaxID=2219043 RepID=A0A9N7L526_9BACT|nr:ElyC/SanA/YdcF family protein [Capsulimonas corticalis]BDI31816.1 membrane protein [Capsulimonas corticalis]
MAGAIALACAGATGAAIWNQVRREGQPIYRDVASTPPAPVAIVFGAGYSGDSLSPILSDRVDAGVDLYRAGKVKKLLMTGDNGRNGYNEPEAMKAAAVRRGVPSKDIVCDYAGFRTYDSLYRARDVFGVKSAILVTQTYHLYRALYTGRKLGLTVTGLAADRQQYLGQQFFDAREIFSTERAWIDVNVTHARPKYLGAKEHGLDGVG